MYRKSTTVKSVRQIPANNTQRHTTTDEKPRSKHPVIRETLSESYRLVWLAKDETNNIIPVANVRSVVNDFKHFQDAKQCIEYLKQSENTIFLVCSEKFGPLIVPEVYQLKHIWSIHIYNNDIQNDPHFVHSYSQVKIIFAKTSHLLESLTKDVQQYLKHEKFAAVMGTESQGNTAEWCYDWWSRYIHLLCYLPYPEDYRLQIIPLLRDYYSGVSSKLTIVDELEKNYKSETVIWWYTRATFFCELLNRACRQHNIELLFLFGSYVQDIYQQLKKENDAFKEKRSSEKSKMLVYRGQVMPTYEFNHHIASSVMNNSLLSTSLNRKKAIEFVGFATMKDDYIRALFEIEIDLNEITRPYALISHLSDIPDEEEVLFMIATDFRVQPDSLEYNEEDKVWVKKLRLYNYHEINDINKFDTTITERRLKDCVNDLFDENQTSKPMFDDAMMIFEKLNEICPTKKWIKAIKHRYIAVKHHSTITDWDLRIRHDPSAAIKNYNDALKFCLKMDIKTNGNEKEQDYAEFIKCKQLSGENMLKYTSLNDSSFRDRLMEPGWIYASNRKYDEALNIYEHVIDIYLKESKLDYDWIIRKVSDVIEIYTTQKNDYNSALKYQLIKHECTLKQNQANLTDSYDTSQRKKRYIADEQVELADLYTKLHFYKEAYELYGAALKLRQELSDRFVRHEEIQDIQEKIESIRNNIES
ncbi:unnamed protein product [Adineta ricciae]|uniref:Uncharacterized protein n=1 Tax=Adineta ricciae TaxID=249248 RepID=A0A814DII6_ADIRI|nr:unnamed protein product [Adineta ricciae]CAF1376540.1 unnamed protein product [Adineta ricciae]